MERRRNNNNDDKRKRQIFNHEYSISSCKLKTGIIITVMTLACSSLLHFLPIVRAVTKSRVNIQGYSVTGGITGRVEILYKIKRSKCRIKFF